MSLFSRPVKLLPRAIIRKTFEHNNRPYYIFLCLASSFQSASIDHIFPSLLLTLSDDEGVDIDDQPLINDNQRRMQLLVVDNELEYNESMITQREDEILEIEQGISELNEIFRDLGTMVHEQGSMLGMFDQKRYFHLFSCAFPCLLSLY